MMEIIEVLQEPWAYRAFIASSIVGIICGLLGVFIVLRNMSLIGDALAHAVLPGVVLAFVIFNHPLSIFFGAIVAGLLSSFLITWIQDHVKTKNDAAIGIVFITMFSIGVIMISAFSQRGGVHIDLKDFLFGSVLGVSDDDLMMSVIILVIVVFSVIFGYRYLFLTTFQSSIARVMGISVNFVHYFLMLLLSFAVVASLRTVGVILVVAMLITPASTALLLSDNLRKVLALSALLGMLAAIAGLIISIIYDTTPGPAMAVVSAVIYGLTVIFAPRKGKLATYLHSRRLQAKILREDIIKHILKSGGTSTVEKAAEKLGQRVARIAKQVQRLQQDQLLHMQSGQMTLQLAGEDRASELVRAHRLWETYLVDKVGLSSDQIHLEAEDQEHHLTPEMLDEVDELLGYPSTDPHGSPIPMKRIRGRVLRDLAVGDMARIHETQEESRIMQYLWEHDIKPLSEFTLVEQGQHTYELHLVEGRVIELPRSLARALRIHDA